MLKSKGTPFIPYAEDALKIADKLDIKYVLARGTAGARAIVYRPEEYGVKIISVSNVPSRNT